MPLMSDLRSATLVAVVDIPIVIREILCLVVRLRTSRTRRMNAGDGMVGFALQPASLATVSVAQHYADTIAEPVAYSEHQDLLPPDVLESLRELFPKGRARFWGVTPDSRGINENRFNKLRLGDGVAFYGQGRLYAAGRVAVLFRSEQLADRLWGRQDDGRTWQFMYAIADFHQVDVGIREVQQIMGWKSGAVVQNFQVAVDGPARDLAQLCGVELDQPLTPEQTLEVVRIPREHAEWLADSPASSDALKRRALAGVLAKRLNMVRTQSPHESFLMHIDGPWGAGKSTLLQLLKAELKNDCIVVEFDAWRNSRVSPPWWALLTTLRDELPRALPWYRRILLRSQEVLQRVRRSGAPYLLSFLLVGVLALAVGVFVYWSVDQFTDLSKSGEFVWRAFQSVSVLVSIVVTLGTGALALGRILLWESARGAKLYEQASVDPMQNVAAHFGWLLNRAQRPVAFFIDDLDRCKEDQVVALLEAAQTMMRTAPAVRGKAQTPVSFVVAADGAWLRCAYEIVYDKFKTAVDEPGRSLGYLFLDKLFQLSVPLPAIGPSGQRTYFRSLLGTQVAEEDESLGEEIGELRKVIQSSGTESDVLKALQGASEAARERVGPEAITRMAEPDLVEDVEHALEPFAPLLDNNPRRMKRFINCYTVIRAARTIEGSVIDTEVLALWVLLQTRWPELAEYLQRKPDAIEAIGRKERPRGCPDSLLGLISSRDLREVLKQAPKPLTGDLIRTCCGAQLDAELDETDLNAG